MNTDFVGGGSDDLAGIIGVRFILLCLLAGWLSACSDRPWNNPYPGSEKERDILYSSFSEKPKHLDPAQSYSSNEVVITGQIYEPPLQYHYLERPYTLIPLVADSMPRPEYFDADGRRLPEDAPVEQIRFSIYDIHIQPGIHYQPHPAFAKDSSGRFLYHDLSPDMLAGIKKLGDFAETGTRELVADDYVYQIKRLAHPRLHSPIYGLMTEYIVGLKDYAATLAAGDRTSDDAESYLDLTRFPLEGAQVIDRYTYRLKIHGS